MPNPPRIDEQTFIELYQSHGPGWIAKEYGLALRNVNARRKRIEAKSGTIIEAPRKVLQRRNEMLPAMLPMDVEDGHVVIGSDPHYHPGLISTAHAGMVQTIKRLKPKAVIMNGDVFDGASVSRHPPIGWERMPTVEEELEACKERLDEIASASDAELFWPLGNHDSRYETKLASVAPEFARVHGVSLHHHFGEEWQHCWGVTINDDVVVKHRWKGGDHAAYNNTMRAGKNTITGHLHKGYVRPFTDYNGTRYGVDLPTLAEPYGPQFRDYTEMNPVDWRSGFCVLTFRGGKLLQPQLAITMEEGVYELMGEVYEVSGEDL